MSLYARFAAVTASLLALTSPLQAHLAVEWKQGSRQDTLQWSIAGRDNKPNILSELSWEVEDIDYSGPNIIWMSQSGWTLRLAAGYGDITEGENQDSDYLGSDRTLEFSRSNNTIGGDWVADGLLALGFPLNLPILPIQLLPQGGVSVHVQKLRITDGWQTIGYVATTSGVTPAPISRIENLDSTYKTTWLGPFLGIQGKLSVALGCTLRGGIEHHWASYRGKGVWNLRHDIGEFTDEARGRGWVWTGGVEFPVSAFWRAAIDYSLQEWKTGSGTQSTPVLNNGQWVTVEGPFNSATLHSERFLISLGCAF